MGKQRLNTKRLRHRAARQEALDAKAERVVVDSGFRYRHDEQMSKMLRGVDLDRFERLADG